VSAQTLRPQGSPAGDDSEVGALYWELLDCWNRRDAHAYAALFEQEGHVVGFDGSVMNGRAEIEAHIGQVFADHMTAAYVGKVRGVRFLTPEVAVLRAVAGMVPPGQSAINPAVNAIQTVVAAKDEDGQWRIALFQNTPAQFHGRPEVGLQLTEELGELLE
jgi:uncharacterized protein (TIGR02246 family)